MYLLLQKALRKKPKTDFASLSWISKGQWENKIQRNYLSLEPLVVRPSKRPVVTNSDIYIIKTANCSKNSKKKSI